jgi:hypothetical protein
MSRGAVTAYIRVPAQRQMGGLRLLHEAGYVAERDSGDPDRPSDSVDLYVERHYGMTNPDERVRELLVSGLDEILDTAGIRHEYRGGGVIHGEDNPRASLIEVVDADTMEPNGFIIQAATHRQADRFLTVVAETLGLPRGALTFTAPAGWQGYGATL